MCVNGVCVVQCMRLLCAMIATFDAAIGMLQQEL
jgi:hypothetical protein